MHFTRTIEKLKLATTILSVFCFVGPSTTTITSSELILNDGFQQALVGWSAIGNATLNVIADPQPLSAEFPNSLVFTVGSDIDQVGFENSGFGGIPFNESLTYTGSFFMRFPIESTFGGIITTGIMGPGESTILASAPGELVGAFDGQWLHIQFTLQNTGKIVTSTDNKFFVSVDAQPWIGQIVHFTSFSLHSSSSIRLHHRDGEDIK